MSDFFRSRVENLPDGTTEIALEEDEIYKAVSILSEVADLYSKIKPLPPVVAWDKAKAILSTKWLFKEHVKAYSSVVTQHIEAVLKQPIDVSAFVEITGATGWTSDVATPTSTPHPINGTYDRTDERYGELPVYHRRGLTPNGNQLILVYCAPRKAWVIKWKEDIGTNRACASVKCDPPVLPYLIKGTWSVFGRDVPGGDAKFHDQPVIKVYPSRASSLPRDVLIFWEMIHTIYQYVGLRTEDGPVHTMEKLVQELSKKEHLCVQEEMAKLMSKHDLILLQQSRVDRRRTAQ
jgi:hypothetical protein